MFSNVTGDLKRGDFSSSLNSRLQSQTDVDEFNIENRQKIGRELNLEHMENDVRKRKWVFDRLFKIKTDD